MELSSYQRLALQHALHVIACDGEIHPSEVDELRRLAEDTPYFDEIDSDAELAGALAELRSRGVDAITAGLDRLSNEDLTPRQRLKMLEILLRVVHADDNVEPAECAYLQQAQGALRVTTEEIAKHYPAHFSLFMPGAAQSFRSGPGFKLPDSIPESFTLGTD
jgi:uncharacterized tellurite resistance protein B-like protein